MQQHGYAIPVLFQKEVMEGFPVTWFSYQKFTKTFWKLFQRTLIGMEQKRCPAHSYFHRMECFIRKERQSRKPSAQYLARAPEMVEIARHLHLL